MEEKTPFDNPAEVPYVDPPQPIINPFEEKIIRQSKYIEHLENKLKGREITVRGDLEIEARYVLFADGLFAKMLKTFYRKGDKYVFFLYPSKSLEVQYLLKEKRESDVTYNKQEDIYIKEYPIEVCHLINPHPVFQRWWIFANWEGEHQDPFEKFNSGLYNRLKSLQAERDALAGRLRSMGRMMQEQSKYPEAEQQKMMDAIERISLKLSQKQGERL